MVKVTGGLTGGECTTSVRTDELNLYRYQWSGMDGAWGSSRVSGTVYPIYDCTS
ncbi:hypothetical protein [Streptomyces sp. NPDC002845]